MKPENMSQTFYEANEALGDFCYKDFVFYPQFDTPMAGGKGLIAIAQKRETSLLFRTSKY
ncbi:hypothetical protein DX928_00690 [Bacillus swezeyi]|nr:hypothetical protein DX928_00690 [Bacillus swezeyi]